MKFFLISLPIFVVVVFSLSNIVLPIFYSIPKIIKEKKAGNITKKIPINMIILAPIINLIILISLYTFLLYKYPTHLSKFYISLGFCLLILIFSKKSKNDMNDDFKRTYKEYLNSQ